MKSEIKYVLTKLLNNGYEAYVVGGYVRDYLLGIHSIDVDICTNALPKDIIKIFNIKHQTDSYGSISLKKGDYNFDITTYRKESDYKNRKPQKVEYTSNLLLDLNRRDFTINAICMNVDEKIIDYLQGQEDLENRVIKVIGPCDEKLTEDPLRMLRAIRFAINLDFAIDEEIIKSIECNKDLIKGLSYTRKRNELDKIFSSKNIYKGLKILKDLKLLSTLEINYDKIIEVRDLLGIWAQLEFSSNYPFTKNNLAIINSIRRIIKAKEISNKTLFKEGLYVNLIAGEILGINKHIINERYAKLPIYSNQDLMVDSNDIMNILDLEPSSTLRVINEDLINKILDNKLHNNYEDIKDYLLKNWK